MPTLHKNRKPRFMNILYRYCSCLLKAKGKRPRRGKTTIAKRESSKAVSICNLKDPYYTTRELSGILNLPMDTLAGYRRRGIGPQHIAFGYRSYRYPREGILKFVVEKIRISASVPKNYNLKPQKKG